jgi:hypothetical protein
MRGERRTCWALALLALSAACEEAPATVPEDEFVSAMVNSWCGAELTACCSLSGLPHDAASCAASELQHWQAQVEKAKAAHATYDPVAAGRCIAARRDTLSACEPAKTRDVDWVLVCAAVYRHAQTSFGASCSIHWECADTPLGRGQCVPVFGAGAITYQCRGTLATLGVGEMAELLDDGQTTRICKPGLFVGRDGRCFAPIAFDEACSNAAVNAGDPCVQGAVCDASNTERCVVALPLGAACSSPLECDGLACREGHCALASNIACE